MNTKDLFSHQSKTYAAFRPTYPDSLYEFIFRHLKNRSAAWDCATGNGQVAQYLCKEFTTVQATDISEKQLTHAFRADNIFYSVQPAEKTSFPEHQFDLVTVAQALHWLDREKFYNEVKRVGKTGGLLAVWGYSLLKTGPDTDDLLMDFYKNVVGPYWDNARRLVDEEYKNIAFPFTEIPSPPFHFEVRWTLEHLCGYLESWSATVQYIKQKNVNPVPALAENLKKHWKEGTTRTISFPTFIRLGRI